MKHKNHREIHPPFSRWLLFQWRAIGAALADMRHTPFVNCITICMIGLAIALPLGFFILVQNLQYLDGVWGTTTPTISLYLKTEIGNAEAEAFLSTLKENPAIEKVSYTSPEEGLKDFKKSAPLESALHLFEHNPLPGVVVVLPNKKEWSPEAMQNLYDTLKKRPEVDIAQLDQLWVSRLMNIITIGKSVTNALFLLFGFGVVLIIGHTLHASLDNHLKEIQVLRLMGANEHFIRNPLVYGGVLYGILGGTIAWIGVNFFLIHLQGPVSHLAETYESAFHLKNISFLQGSLLLCICAILGFIGAWLISTQFLHQTECLD